jgi:hypothetical protein
MTSSPFPLATEVPPFKADSFRAPAEAELTRRRAMPPAFYQHVTEAPVRGDLLSRKPRLLSAFKA